MTNCECVARTGPHDGGYIAVHTSGTDPSHLQQLLHQRSDVVKTGRCNTGPVVFNQVTGRPGHTLNKEADGPERRQGLSKMLQRCVMLEADPSRRTPLHAA